MRKFALAAIALLTLSGCVVAEPVIGHGPPRVYYEPPPAYYYYPPPPPRVYGPAFGFNFNYGYGRGGYGRGGHHGRGRW